HKSRRARLSAGRVVSAVAVDDIDPDREQVCEVLRNSNIIEKPDRRLRIQLDPEEPAAEVLIERARAAEDAAQQDDRRRQRRGHLRAPPTRRRPRIQGRRRSLAPPRRRANFASFEEKEPMAASYGAEDRNHALNQKEAVYPFDQPKARFRQNART